MPSYNTETAALELAQALNAVSQHRYIVRFIAGKWRVLRRRG